ncbi:MAG: pyridoxamine kinase [Prevotella sp.]|nr:pyridoxamine kinase [Prevotella sp.]MBR7053424.1 pyridoxamine kinase [Prevotella sp.]
MEHFPKVVEQVARQLAETLEDEGAAKKQILLINDMAGYGKVATAAMLPILSYMGLPVYNLPTALVSNTLDYGKFNILDTTDYITGVFPVWKELGFRFDAIATGFIASERQARIVSEYCLEQAANGTVIFVDPIMGDEGKLYNGVTPDTIRSMQEMLTVAHLCYPNYTEACYLTGADYHTDGVSVQEACSLVDALRKMGSKSVLITSMLVDGKHCVVGYNHHSKEYLKLEYTEIPVHFPGTGDIFSAVLIGHLLKGDSLVSSTRKAMDAVALLIELNKDNVDKNRGIPLENFLYLL